MATVALYTLDATGVSEKNKIKGEVHALIDSKPIRAIAPRQGIFFVDSLEIIDEDGNQLMRNIDYVVAELYISLSFKYDKEVAGIILIKNPHLDNKITLNYQVLGDQYSQKQDKLAEFINSKDAGVLGLKGWDELLKPGFIVPNPVVHDLGRNYGFEYVNYALERMRQTIAGAESASQDYILNFINEFQKSIDKMINDEINIGLKDELERYRAKFTKELAGLGHVINLKAATEAEGATYGNKDYQFQQASDDRYIVTKALMGFKETLYTAFVSSDRTGIDRYKGVLATSLFDTFFSMTNETRYVLDSIENVQLAKVPYDLNVYPDPTIQDSKWIIHKLTNNLEDRSGTFLAYSIRANEIYSGILKRNRNGSAVMTWLKHITRKDSDEYIQKLIEHMEDTSNPHDVLKFHINLGEVENLAVVTREDVICRKPVRKYVTYDALLLFWKVFMKDVKTLGEEEDPNTEVTLAERFRLIFAPCGPCGTDPYQPPPQIANEKVNMEPRDRLLAVWCVRYDKYGRFSDGFGGSYEKLIEEKSLDCRYKKPLEFQERGTLISSYCEGTTLYGRYSDGKNSYYVAEIERNSGSCGGTIAGTYILIEILNSKGEVIGMGYTGQRDTPDDDAKVLLSDQQGNPVAYIYASPTTRTKFGFTATVEVKGPNNLTVGYAINR